MIKLQSFLFAFLSLSHISGDPSVVDLSSDKRYHKKHQLSSIDGSTCSEVFYHNDDYDADLCDPKYDKTCVPDEYDEPVCHISRINDTLVDEEIVKLMETDSKTCCPFHGFIETGTCSGTDKMGNNVVFSNVDICVKHTLDTEVKPALECPLHCDLVHDFLDLTAKPIKDGVLTYKAKQYDNFCLGLKCDDGGERFQPWFEACGGCINDDMNKNLADRIDVPNCCRLDDTLNRKSMECSTEPTNVKLEQMFPASYITLKNSCSVKSVEKLYYLTLRLLSIVQA